MSTRTTSSGSYGSSASPGVLSSSNGSGVQHIDTFTLRGDFDGREYGSDYLAVRRDDIVQKLPHGENSEDWVYVMIKCCSDGTLCKDLRGWVPQNYLVASSGP